MKTMNLISSSNNETTVAVVRETAKAILVKGGCSEAWFPKSAINEFGEIAEWFRFDLVHCFLFDTPFDPAKSPVGVA